MKKNSVVMAIILLFSLFNFSCSGGRTVCATSYEINCSLENDVLSGEEKVVFYNDSDNSIKQLKFNLFGNAFRKDAKYKPISEQHEHVAYPSGASYGEMQIISVTERGAPLNFSIDGEDKNVLTVELSNEIFPCESVQVEISFKLKLANVLARTGITEKAVNLGNFYPVLCKLTDNGFYECLYYHNGDPFYSDVANYKVTITANEDYVIASSGKEQSKEYSNGKVKKTFCINSARSFAMVLSTEFKTETAWCDKTKVNYYYYKDENPKQSIEYAVKSLKYFSNVFGVYPFEEYTVVQTGFVQGGMEYCSLVYVSDAVEQISIGEVIVHETAHQWWQVMVGNNEIEHGFLDEGLAEYSVILFYENYPEYNLTREQLVLSAEKTYKTYCSVYEKLFGSLDTKMLRSLKDFTSEYEYVNLSYIKPCIMYDCLRKTIGDKKFFDSLKKYFNDYKYKTATPDDLVGAFEKKGASSNGYFYSFFDGKVVL